jgi:hypothetical protein
MPAASLSGCHTEATLLLLTAGTQASMRDGPPLSNSKLTTPSS